MQAMESIKLPVYLIGPDMHLIVTGFETASMFSRCYNQWQQNMSLRTVKSGHYRFLSVSSCVTQLVSLYCWLFNDAVSSSVCRHIALDGKMISEWVLGKDVEWGQGIIWCIVVASVWRAVSGPGFELETCLIRSRSAASRLSVIRILVGLSFLMVTTPSQTRLWQSSHGGGNSAAEM
jgi:hypothetical protein